MSKELENNRLQLKTSIECARWLAFHACAFKGHDESLDSKNRGNFIELIKFTSTFIYHHILEHVGNSIEIPNL